MGRTSLTLVEADVYGHKILACCLEVKARQQCSSTVGQLFSAEHILYKLARKVLGGPLLSYRIRFRASLDTLISGT